MSIVFNEVDKTFTIETKRTTYQMQVDKFGFLLHLYYGKKLSGCMDYLLTYADRGFSGNPYAASLDRTYSMDVLPQEYPTYGTGDYRNTAMIIRNADGTFDFDPRFKKYEILDGKYSLEGFPSVYADEEDAQTLKIYMEDPASKVQLTLYYGVLPEIDIITRAVVVTNGGIGKLDVRRAMSACLDFNPGRRDMMTFYGRHCMERQVERTEIKHGVHMIGSRRGTSSHQYNPFVIICDHDAREEHGYCYGMSFVYSGNFLAEIEKDQFNNERALIGLQPDLFAYPLEHDQSFVVPETIMTFSDHGFSRMSWNMHRCIREHVCRGKFKDQVRPILINSWEAAYFNFDGEKIYQLAKSASELGIEMVVMDDGWFGHRPDDNSGLGDWVVNENKLGESLSHLVERINDLGMKFGIWFEPECINENSDLYREHPEWVLMIPGRNPVRARNQLVLDFSRKEVVDYIFDKMCKVLDQANIEYVKWDMNTSITNVYSQTTGRSGRVLYDYVRGLYDFLERINQRYPDIMIEGCSGGGGRYDAGMMYYAPQIWLSDNTDAIDRLKIQYGSSFGYPISTVGSHVSDVPNHQTGRSASFKTRGIVAMAGSFGYELNPAKLTEEEREMIKEQVKEYKRDAKLIQKGFYYRLSNPFEDEYCAWEFIAEDKSEVLLQAVMTESHGNMTVNYVHLHALQKDAFYKEESSGRIYSAEALMYGGMPLPVEFGDYNSYKYRFTIVEQ